MGGIPEAPQHQFFTPGAPEVAQQQPSAPAYGMQPQQPYANGQMGQGVGGGYPGSAGPAQGGMAGLTNQFSNMGVGATKGVSSDSAANVVASFRAVN